MSASSEDEDYNLTDMSCSGRPANILDFQFPKDNNRKHMLILGNLAGHLIGESSDEQVSPSRSSQAVTCR